MAKDKMYIETNKIIKTNMGMERVYKSNGKQYIIIGNKAREINKKAGVDVRMIERYNPNYYKPKKKRKAQPRYGKNSLLGVMSSLKKIKL
jgi:hypothetical protein